MKGKIEYLLKHNIAFQKLYRAIAGAAIRVLGLFCRTDENLVLFSSFNGKRFNDSPKAIFDSMLQRDDCKTLKYIWAFNDPEQFDVPGAKKIKMDSFNYFVAALRAKYWIANVNIERGLKFKKKETVYLNTLHGTPIKTIGNAVPGRSDYDFSNVDIIPVDGDHQRSVIIKDTGALSDSIMFCGRPANDVLFNEIDSGDRVKAKEKLGISSDKRVVLYVPTWRDSVDGGATYTFDPPLNFENWKKRLGEQTVILYRAHSITSKTLGMKFDEQVWDVSLHGDVNDLLLAADVLVSDYSSIFFDYAILGRPMLCFSYDYDEYSESRGLYFDIRDHISSFCFEMGLLNYICDMDIGLESKKAAAFFDRFSGFGGSSTSQCIDALLERGKA